MDEIEVLAVGFDGAVTGGEGELYFRPKDAPTKKSYLRMLTARAATMTASTRLAADSTSISIFAQRLSGRASVGLNAVAFVKAR
jgi:hypothetical protein